MARKMVVGVLADTTAFTASMKEATVVSERFSGAVTSGSKVAAQAVVAASVKTTESLRLQAVAYREIAAAAETGSAEQIAAARLAERAELKLAAAMGVTSAEATRLRAGTSGASRELQSLGRGALSSSGLFHGFGRSIAFASTTFLGGAGLVAAIKGSSEAASNMAEQISKSNVVFAGSAKAVEGWATGSATAMGLAQDQALATASSFGALLRPIGLTGRAAADQSEKLTQLGADLASFYNTSVQDALDAVQSGIVGESRPLRSYGVLLSEARVQQEALSETGKTNAKQLTNQEKVLARIAIIYKDTAQAQGDFARTSGGLANQQRILAANVRNLEASIGTALNPVLLDVITNLNAWLGKSENQQRVQKDVKQAVDLAVRAFKDAKKALDDVNKITGSTKDTLKLLVGVFVGFKALRLVSWFEGLAGSIGGVGTAASTATGEAAGLSTGLSGLTAAPWIITVLVAYKDIKDPGSIVDRAKSFFNFAKGGGPLEKALENLPNIGPIIKSINQATGAFSRGRPPLSREYFVPRPAAQPFVPHDLPTVQAAAPIVGRGGLSPLRRAQLAVSAAARTKGTKDDLAALVTQEQLLAKAIATETARLSQATSAKEARKFADNLQKLQDQDAAAISQIASIAKKRQGKTPTELAAQRNTFFDNAITRMLDRVTDITSAGGRVAALEKVNALITKRIAVTKDVTRKLNLEDQVIANLRTIKSERTTQQQDVIDALSLNVDRAGLTTTLTDDIATLQTVNAKLAEQQKQFGYTRDREQQIIANQANLKGLRQQQQQNALDPFTLALDRAALTKTPNDNIAALKAMNAKLAEQNRLYGVTKDRERQIIANQGQIQGLRKEARDTARQNLLDQLQFNVDKTQLTKSLQDDLVELRKQQAGIEKQIATAGSTLARQQALLAVELAINAKNKEIRDARKARVAAAFQSRLDWAQVAVDRASLTDNLTGELNGYNKQVAIINEQIRAQGDTAALEEQKLGILKSINDLRKQQLDQATKAAGTSHKLFKTLNATAFVNQFGAGLTRTQKLRIEAGLSAMGPGGTFPAGHSGQFTAGVTINGGVHMHGVQDVPGLENQIAKRAKARPHVRRGARG